MKRRDFIKVSSTASVAALVAPGYDALANTGVKGFDLHPFLSILHLYKIKLIQREFMMRRLSLQMRCLLKLRTETVFQIRRK
jgi:hypothetical protein